MTKIYIIDDHPLFINGLISIFEDKADNIHITGYSINAKEVIRRIKQIHADVVLLDLLMPGINGLDLLPLLKQSWPSIKIIALTASTDPVQLMNAWRAGVDGILMKDSGKKELISAIKTVMKGEKHIGASTPTFPKEKFFISKASHPRLTRREIQILNLLAKRLSRKEVSEILGVSKYAIDFHCRNIFKKLNKSNLSKAVEAARKAQLLTS